MPLNMTDGRDSLPHRQLRKTPADKADWLAKFTAAQAAQKHRPSRGCAMQHSLPHRQLRKRYAARVCELYYSLPHRQLRNEQQAMDL